MLSSFHKSRSIVRTFSSRFYWREVLAVLILLLAIVFLRSQRNELHAIGPDLQHAAAFWLIIGILITVAYIILQSSIYKACFAAIGLQLKWAYAMELFLKRNFISVFLPAGGVSSLAYSPSQIRKQGFNQSQIHQASGLFALISLLTVFLFGFPVIVYTILKYSQFSDLWIGLAALFLFLILAFFAFHSIKHQGKLYHWLQKHAPVLLPAMNKTFSAHVNYRSIFLAICNSMGVELCGALHVLIAMMALGFHADPGAAAAAYIISVLMMMVSPFLRGLGAVEVSMVYVLEQFGYTETQALSITILYRVFEFWLPLLSGIFAFGWRRRKLLLRVIPVLFTFILGVVNIISVIRPRNHLTNPLRDYFPLQAIHASYLLVLFLGIGLLVISAYLLRGLRNAWVAAILFSCISLIGHLTKALDFEEAFIAAATIAILIYTSKQYRLHSNFKWIKSGFKTSAAGFAAVLIFGFTCFYFVDVRHFGENFTWQQSLLLTLKSLLLIQDNRIYPLTWFGQELIWIIRIISFFHWLFLMLVLIIPKFQKGNINELTREKALDLLKQFGNSPSDYFKLYKDKLIFLSEKYHGFISYRIAGGFAIVLEEPVCPEDLKISVLIEFDKQCRIMGLKPAFYRVDENSIPLFEQLHKTKLLIGQEARLEIDQFSLEGRDKKALRNSLNSLQKKGFLTEIRYAPQDDEFLEQLKIVSDDWLHNFQKRESVFSQGSFDENELKYQDIIAVMDAAGMVKAFLNIIPDYAKDECTYDLIRKSNDAPGGVMDALIIKLIDYTRQSNRAYLNLGMVPMTGLNQPDTGAEKFINLAATKLKRFQHYKGLRIFKEKYATAWKNKYLIYDNDFDLLQLPMALNKVMKP